MTMRISKPTIFAGVAIALAACQMSDIEEPSSTPDSSARYPVHLTLEEAPAPAEASTHENKTAWNGEKIIWTAGDRIKMGYTFNGEWEKALYTSDPLAADKATAQFEVTAMTGGGSGTYDFYALYPASATSGDMDSAPTVAVSIPAAQTPLAGSFDPEADLMLARSTETYGAMPAESIPLLWQRLVAHGDITLKNFSPGAGEEIVSVKVLAQDGAALAGDFTLDLETGILAVADAVNTITLDAANLSLEGSSLRLWLAMAPQTITAITVIVETDKAYYTRAVSSLSFNFLANKRNTLGINMSAAARSEKVFAPLAEEPADWSGRYLIGGDGHFFAGQYSTKDYGAYVSLSTDSDGNVSYSDGIAYVVDIQASEHGYTIKYGDQYLGYTSEAGSANELKFNSFFSENKYEWTLAFDEGITTVTNVYKSNRLLMWNNNSGQERFSTYAGTMHNITLYRLGSASEGNPSLSLLQSIVNGVAWGGGALSIDGAYILANGADSDIRISYDDTVISSVTASGGSLNYAISANGYTHRSTVITLTYAGREHNIQINQAARPGYVLVTGSTEDWSGEYLLSSLYSSGVSTNILTGQGAGTYGGYTSASVSSSIIDAGSTDSYMVTIAKVTDGKYTVKVGSKYLYYTGSSNNLYFGDSVSGDTYYWTISYSASGITFTNFASSTRTIRWNHYSGQERFAAYTSNTLPLVSLWRRNIPTVDPGAVLANWLELPSYNTSAMSGTTTSSLANLYNLTHYALVGGVQERNYTMLYDPEMYASYWIAYPLAAGHLGTGRDESWAYDPDVPSDEQTKLSSGAYGVYLSTTNYSSNYYARGHQIPNADRNGNDEMMAQTYYSTNITPQIQNGYNGGIWSSLETAVRNLTADCDTVYVVTGAAFRDKTIGTESITTIVSTRDSKTLPVPNYYWKVLLKVRRSGATITNASAIGFWLPHGDDLKGHSYTEYVTSVDVIECKTGFDFFANLSDGLQSSAEANTNWSTFSSF